MIEIKVNTIETDGHKQTISVESSAKHSGTYGEFVGEMYHVFEVLDKTDHEVFRDALNRYMIHRIVDKLENDDESEGEEC